MDDREEEARRARYSARHAAIEAEKAAPPPAPATRRLLPGWPGPLSAKGLYHAIRRRLPPELKQSRVAEPAKWALRQYRRRFGPPKPPPPPISLPPDAEDGPRWRAQVLAQNSRAPQPPLTHSPSVAALILNRNGAHHLRQLFASLVAHEPYPALELVVVDHGSTDDSRQVLGEWAQRLPLRTILKDENESFSKSTNDAARATEAELLLLLNNDLIWTEVVVARLAAELADPQVGLVGCTLQFPAHYPGFPNGQQHGGIKVYADREAQFFRPYNLSARHHLTQGGRGVEPFLAVTAALALCRRADYLAVGGLDEAYFYGYEDVDLALRLADHLGKQTVMHHEVRAIHDESATQVKDPGQALRQRRERNRQRLDQQHGLRLRRRLFREKLEGTRLASDAPLSIGLVVTEATPGTAAGDYYTAKELGEALVAGGGVEIGFVAQRGPAPYQVAGYDVLIVMIDGYDLSKLEGAEPGLLKVAWLRNWFDRWTTRPWFDRYDVLWVSSQKAAAHLSAQGRVPEVVRIGTALSRFGAGRADPAFAADYAFTGSHWGAPREIEQLLDPALVGGRFALYGEGWKDHPLAPYHRGFVAYDRLPDVYASTKITIDDANHVTKPWASVNSRVFDALAAGSLVLSNGVEGAKEVFGEALPTFETKAELTTLLRRYLDDEPARRAKVAELQVILQREHGYQHRAQTVRANLRRFTEDRLRIAIKVPAPNPKVAKDWGDYHYALALRRAFWRRGHAVRIDLLPDWHGPAVLGDDLVLVLRGLSAYRPDPKQVNLLWNISHPEQVSPAEYQSYDQVFVASRPYARQLSHLSVPVEPLLQCTDETLFFPDPGSTAPAHPLLFVGNSRRHRRPIIEDALAAGLPLSVYGGLWEGLIPAETWKSPHVENTELRGYYGRAGVVLNDHWAAMRGLGFVSNRLFDAIAAGAIVISDPAAGLSEIFGDAVETYETVAELKAKVEAAWREPERYRTRALEASARIRKDHTFEARAETILTVGRSLLEQKERGTR